MSISDTDIVNMIIEVVGVMVSVFSIFMLSCGLARDRTMKRYFLFGFSALLFYHLSLLGVVLLNMYPSRELRYLLLAAGFLTYVMGTVTAYAISVFLVDCLSLDSVYDGTLKIFLSGYLFLQMIIFLYAQLTGKLALINSQHQYADGSLNALGYTMIASYMVIDLILLIRHGSILRPKQRWAFAFYMGFPLLAIFARPLFPGIYLVAFSSSIALMIMLGLLILEQQKIYDDQRAKEEQARIDLMLSQIQPHFLFNSLYVIQEICHTDPETASRAIEDFSRYLRHNMDSIAINQPIPFSEELQHTKIYVSLQQLRFGEVLNVNYDLAATDFRLPSLALQPIVENAIRYGVRQNENGAGTVLIRTSETDDLWEISVTDNGPGFDPSKIPQDGASHVGLNNVRERLKRISGGNLLIESEIGKGTKVTIQLPKEGHTCSSM